MEVIMEAWRAGADRFSYNVISDCHVKLCLLQLQLKVNNGGWDLTVNF